MAVHAHDAQDSEPNDARTFDPMEDQPAALQLLTTTELHLLQSVTLSHAQDAIAPAAILLFSRAWFKLEQERRRRKIEIRDRKSVV